MFRSHSHEDIIGEQADTLRLSSAHFSSYTHGHNFHPAGTPLTASWAPTSNRDMCKAISIQQVNMATIGCNDDVSFDLSVKSSRNDQRSFGSFGASTGVQTSPPYQRPSMRGWWICSHCKNHMNPAFTKDVCLICSHPKCRDCYVYQK